MSNSSIMSIRELIDTAFGDSDENIINFKLIQTVLLILAKQLRILQRRVEVNIDPNTMIRTTSNVSITEVKLKATVPKRRRKNIETDKGIITKTPVAVDSTKSHGLASLKLTTDKSSEKTTSKFSTEPSSYAKNAMRSASEKTKPSTDKSSSIKSSNRESSRDKFDSQAYHLLEVIEQQRERELRIVNQRANSREEAEKSPTPMASLDSLEVQYEKLLIVERAPTDGSNTKTQEHPYDTKGLSIVTQDQFDKLTIIVKELQEKFQPIGKPDFPDNMQLMHDLRKGASLTDAMAALQLSARLDSTEKTLEQMMSLMTELAKQKGIDISTLQGKDMESNETKVIFDTPSHLRDAHGQRSTSHKQSPKGTKKSTSLKSAGTGKIHYEATTDTSEVFEIDDLTKTQPDRVTVIELDEAMQELYDSLLKAVTGTTGKAAANAEDALNLAHKLEEKLNNALSLNNRMDDLEILVSEYAQQINVLDTGLSSQMTNYQEQLTQMQHDLEAGLESMGEALANTGGDTAAVSELNTNFTNLQMDFDATNMKQKELKENQDLLSTDLQSLWKQIEFLVGTKSDREEVADALRDKAGLGALNGLVTLQQFDAVRGDFEKRIGAAYDKFNNQEIIWQKVIDDLLRELNEKADWVQVASLRDDVNNNLVKLRNRVEEMMKVVGEPRAAAISRALFQDAACLSCSSPAHMQLEEPRIPTLPAFKKATQSSIVADDMKPKDDGDHGICYPGKPIPHPPDPRSHICQRYCGGSHTKISTTLKKAPTEIIITPQRQVINEIGSDGKVYRTDAPEQKRRPCLPCNSPERKILQPLENETGHSRHEFGSNSNSTSLDFIPQLKSSMEQVGDNGSMIPPPTVDDED